MKNDHIQPIENPGRLFDCLTYQLKNFPLPDMLAAKEKGAWRKYSTTEVKQYRSN